MLNIISPAAGLNRVGADADAAPPTSLGTLAVGVVVIAALYFGREVFVPMALAILLSFALGPAVLLLRRWHVNRVVAVIAVAVIAFTMILGIGGLIGTQLAHLAENLPGYQTNITEKIHSLRATTTGKGIVGRATTILRDLGNEIANPHVRAGGAPANGPAVVAPGVQQQKPVPVEIRHPDATPFQLIRDIAGPLLQPLAMAGIVIVFVIFFLLQRQDLRDRFIGLAGARSIMPTGSGSRKPSIGSSAIFPTMMTHRHPPSRKERARRHRCRRFSPGRTGAPLARDGGVVHRRSRLAR